MNNPNISATEKKEKIIIDTGIFERELLEKVCREIKEKKKQKANESA